MGIAESHQGLDISLLFGPWETPLENLPRTTRALTCRGIALAAAYKAERQVQGQAQIHLRTKFEAVVLKMSV